MITRKLHTQKIIKIGNSLAVTLDKSYLKDHGLEAGQDVLVQYDATQPRIEISKQQFSGVRDAALVGYTATPRSVRKPRKLTKKQRAAYLSSEITPEFREWVERSLEEDKEAMEELANL